MLNQKPNQNRVSSNTIRLQKSNSEANHTYKKNNRESNYISIKKNKIPREKIFNNRQKQKPKFLIKTHHHISLNSSPFCIICGSINYKTPDLNKTIESIKPHNYYYNPEFSIKKTIENIKKKTRYEYKNIFAENKYKKISYNVISIRNKIINKFIDYSKKIMIGKNTLYLTIILMDEIILKKNFNNVKKIEQTSLGCYFLAVKFLDLAVNSFLISEYQYTNEIAVNYTLEQIRKFEVNCLLSVNYNLGITNFINVLKIFLSNGVLLKSDIKVINTEQCLKNIYFLINKISENLICEDMNYIKYNQFNMACAILYLSRHIIKLDPWPDIFNILYDTTFDDFSEEYNYVNNFCENNILTSHLGNKKRQRNNSTCKNINMKRISFNSTFNNSNNNNNIKYIINNGNNSSKVENKNNSNNIINNALNNKGGRGGSGGKNNIDKYTNYYYHEKNINANNNNNSSLICDTNSNLINYFTNKDSCKKNKYSINNNYSSGKISSKTKAKSNDNGSSKDSIRNKKEKLLDSSSKYIRTQHKLIKNSHQLAFNQSMEMPRKTHIFQNRIYHSRSKKIDNENKINSNRSQHQYNITKNINHPLNDNIDIYKEDNKNKGMKYLEKKNKFRKILNNSELQLNKKNNSQSRLLFFNIKKSSSVKLIADNSKKNNLSNYSNGKNDKEKDKEKIHHLNNNNSSTHKNNKNNEHYINYYHSNTKLKNKEEKNKYIYYKQNINIHHNSSVKKKYDKSEISKEHKDISANLSFITITDTYNLNSQKKGKRNNIKLIDSTIKKNIMNGQKDIDNYQTKNAYNKNRLSHIKYNSCINAKITNINLYDEKFLKVKKEMNTSHKAKHHLEQEKEKDNNKDKDKEKNVNNNINNYYTNIIFNKAKKNNEEKNENNNNNIIIKINLVGRKLDSINRNRLFHRHVKKSSEGIIKKIKINNYNINKRKENSKRKRIDSNVSSYHYKNNNSNNNSSLVVPNNKSNEKNNSDGYQPKNNRNYENKNDRYQFDRRGRNYSMINQKKLKNSNSLL